MKKIKPSEMTMAFLIQDMKRIKLIWERHKWKIRFYKSKDKIEWFVWCIEDIDIFVDKGKRQIKKLGKKYFPIIYLSDKEEDKQKKVLTQHWKWI